MAKADTRITAYITNSYTKSHSVFFECLFDEFTDYDCQEIERSVAEVKKLKRQYLLKTILFPFRILHATIAYGFTGTAQCLRDQRAMWQYIRKPLKEITRSVYDRAMYLR